MRYIWLTLLLTACGTPGVSNLKTPVQTVTITKTVPVYPPDALYSADGACNHAAEKRGSVRTLANDLIGERAAVDVCLGDRAALRQWKKENQAGGK